MQNTCSVKERYRSEDLIRLEYIILIIIMQVMKLFVLTHFFVISYHDTFYFGDEGIPEHCINCRTKWLSMIIL